MEVQLGLSVNARSPIPIRLQLAEQLKHAIASGAIARDHALPSIRELAGFLGINPNTVARVIEDLKRGGYVEPRRGKGVFVAPVTPVHTAPQLRERLLRDVVIRAAALGMTADDVAVGVLSVAATRPAAVQEAARVLLVECSPQELEFFAGALQSQLPVRVDKVLLDDLPAIIRRQRRGHWRAAVTSFSHLPDVERRLMTLGVPVIALLAEAHLETLHQLAHLPSGTRVGVVSAAAETAHNVAHSIANAGLPNIELTGVCPIENAAVGRLVRRVDVVVCSTSAAERVRALAGSTVQVIVDDRALDARGVEMLAAQLVQRDGAQAAVPSPTASSREGLRSSSVRKGQRRSSATHVTVRAQ